MIKLVFSTDVSGFTRIATVLASILRRTCVEVHARVYTRGFSQQDFEREPLRVEFIRCEEDVVGRFPQHVSPAVFDRLRAIKDASDWDRALLMDHDMLVFCDLAEYFGECFEGKLLMGRLLGPGNTLGLQMSRRGGLPADWDHCADYPYFSMGPMMNLEAMRSQGILEKVLTAHQAIGQDEQISLTAACGGQIKEVGRKWNLVPIWDKLDEESGIAAESGGIGVKGDLRWKNGVPEALIHWTGPSKPWHYQSKVWRADLWETESCGWEGLRAGTWHKPVATEVEPADLARARALIRRGWKVWIQSAALGGDAKPLPFPSTYPDLHCQALAPKTAAADAAMVRFGPNADPCVWLESISQLPEKIVLEGPRDADWVSRLRDLGYIGEARISRREWPAGGPHPKVLDYGDPGLPLAIGSREDRYFSRLPADHKPSSHTALSGTDGFTGWEISATLEEFLRQELRGMLPATPTILEFGPGRSTRCLAETFPGAKIISIEHNPDEFRHLRSSLSGFSHVELHHAPLDPALSWYDLSKVVLPDLDFVLVDGPPGKAGHDSRLPALSVFDLIKPGGIAILDDTDRADEKSACIAWLQAGMELLETDETFSVLKKPETLPQKKTATQRGRSVPLSSLAAATYVISLPERKDRLAELRRNWQASAMDHLEFEVVDGVRPETSEILWQEMKGMEGYGKPEYLRGDYVIGAVGCKRAGIRALRTFIDSGLDCALICQDDCRWIHGASESVASALAELPDDWDMVYFSASARSKHQPFSPRLAKLTGARLCTAILWKRRAAIDALSRLEDCDCEMDLLMQRLHQEMNAYCVVPMPAYQAHSFSNILGKFIQPPNS